jgi:HPt (histidine-containing phosphotransfer) domain-containing protein
MADDVIYINFQEGMKRMMNNAGFYTKMLTKFKNENSLNNLDDALAAGDTEKASIAVHTLKGVVSNLSLTELHKLTLELETQIKAGNIDPQQMTVLKNVYSKTIAEIDKVIAQNG